MNKFGLEEMIIFISINLVLVFFMNLSIYNTSKNAEKRSF